MQTNTSTRWSWVAGLAAVAALGLVLIPAALPTGPSANLDAAGALGAGRLGVGALLVFLGGLLTALTPCVYPLIPITVGVFGARPGVGRGKAVLLTSSYVVGMGVVFATLGVIAARTGAAFGALLGHPAVAVGLAVFLLVLAASMFGAFDLTLPEGLALRLNSVGGSGLAGAFLMGSVAGLPRRAVHRAGAHRAPHLRGDHPEHRARRGAALRLRARHRRPVLPHRRLRRPAAEERCLDGLGEERARHPPRRPRGHLRARRLPGAPHRGVLRRPGMGADRRCLARGRSRRGGHPSRGHPSPASAGGHATRS